MYDEEINWSIFDGDPEANCYCRCGKVFRSHAKGVYKGSYRTITRKPCPGCGLNNDCNQISSDPESFSLSR